MASLREIDASKIDFGAKDGKFARTTIEGALPKFKLGSMDALWRAPFGISTPYSGDESEPRRTMDLEITDPDDLAQLTAIDEAVVQAGVKNSVPWFGRMLNEAAVRAMHTPLVIAPKKEEYAPTVRTKVDVVKTVIYVPKGKIAKRVTKDDVVKGSQVAAKVTLSSVMFGNRQFNVSLSVEKLMVKPSADASGASEFGDFVVEEDEPPAKRTKSEEEGFF